jgi:hypothetical protein
VITLLHNAQLHEHQPRPPPRTPVARSRSEGGSVTHHLKRRVTHQSESHNSTQARAVRSFLSLVKSGLRPPPLVAGPGPVLAPLRAAGPAAAHDKGPGDRGGKSSGHRAPCKLIMLLLCVRAGLLRSRSSSRSSLTGQDRYRVPDGITLTREP